MEKKELTRRQMLGRTGLALGGVVGLGVLQACGSDGSAAATNGTGSDTNTNANTDTGGTDTVAPDAGTPSTPARALVSQFPYQQHLPAGYQLDVGPIKEVAYHGYYAGGCCHGAYSALLGHLATTVGAPFDQLPIDFGKFGGGGIASYGSICGAVLGSVLVQNMIVADANARAAMMTDLMRWYEGTAFPAYVPAAIDAGETGLKLDFSAASLVKLQVKTRSHLCHASVSAWCGANQVSASGSDKKARCARLTADVAGKCAQMLNSYLGSGAYKAAAIDGTSATCLGCHGPTTIQHPVAAAMECDTCHSDKVAVQHP